MRSMRVVAVGVLAGCAVAAAEVSGLPGAEPARAASFTQQLTVQVWLTPDLAGATAFADAVATPGSARFHRYLTPDGYTARFGPSAARSAAVAAWLTSAGLAQVRTDAGRDYVSATGPAAVVDSAFRIEARPHQIRVGGNTVLTAGSPSAATVPAALAPDVLGITGLDSGLPASSAVVATPAPACSAYWAQRVQGFRPAFRNLTQAALPVCGYSAAQLRAAYGATAAAAGAGQTVALTEDEAPIAMGQTLADYARANHLPAPRSGQFREVPAKAGAGSCGSAPAAAAAGAPSAAGTYPDEAQLDSEAVYAMAPGASQLMVVGEGGCDEDQDLLDAVTAVLAGNGRHPSASIVSNSWQLPLGEVAASTVHAITVRAAAEGVGLYFASGDSPGLNVTDSDPYVTAVGGTTLGLGAKQNRLFETGWSDDYASLDAGRWSPVGVDSAAGGGTSLAWAQPAYQRGVVPLSMSQVKVGKKTVTDRAVPDIAADADLDSGMLTGYIGSGTSSRPGPYRTELNGGTSMSTPLVAGLVADAQQGQPAAFGFVNPLLYRLSGSSALRDIQPVTDALPQADRAAYQSPAGALSSPGLDVFDTQGHAYAHWTTQLTTRGYDTMTGLGAPDGVAFVKALRAAARSGIEAPRAAARA